MATHSELAEPVQWKPVLSAPFLRQVAVCASIRSGHHSGFPSGPFGHLTYPWAIWSLQERVRHPCIDQDDRQRRDLLRESIYLFGDISRLFHLLQYVGQWYPAGIGTMLCPVPPRSRVTGVSFGGRKTLDRLKSLIFPFHPVHNHVE